MTIQEMHYDFKIKIDKIDTNQKYNFNPAQIDWLLREAQWVWLKNTYGFSKSMKSGFEVTEGRIQDLKALHIKSPEDQPSIPAFIVDTDIYLSRLENLEHDHLFTTRVKAKIRQNNCEKTVGVSIVQTDDLNDAIVDPFNRPNFRFGRVLAVYGRTSNGGSSAIHRNGNGTLYLYSKDFEILEVYIDYIKYPNRMWVGTYNLTDNLLPKNASNAYIYQVGDTPIDCEFNSHTHNEIVDIAVYLASTSIEDPNLVKLKQNKLLINK